MKIKKMNKIMRILLPPNIIAITLAPFGIYYRPEKLSPETLNHEKIHYKQQKEMLIIFFYIWYLLEWLIRILINGKKAYISISFERESYLNSKNKSYLETRKKFAWIKYLKNKK